MAITQKHRVEFTITSIMHTDVEQAIAKDLIKLAEAVSAGETHYGSLPIGPRQKHMVSLFVEGGMEAVASFLVRYSLRESIRELSDEFSTAGTFKFSPASVRKEDA